MRARVTRPLAALFVGLSLSLLVAEPVSAGYIGGAEVAFTGHLYSASRNLNYCGVGHSQIGDNANQAYGAVFTRPSLFFIVCATATTTTGWRNWLGAQVGMLRNGALCGQSAMGTNQEIVFAYGFAAKVCTNPSGWQEWTTFGTHAIFNETTQGSEYGVTLSPWAVY